MQKAMRNADTEIKTNCCVSEQPDYCAPEQKTGCCVSEQPDCCAEQQPSQCCETGARKTVRSAEEKHGLEVRLNRLIGQLNGVKKMVEEDRYCEEVIIQLSAIFQAVRSLAYGMLERHMHHCIVEDIRRGDTASVDQIIALVRRYQ